MDYEQQAYLEQAAAMQQAANVQMQPSQVDTTMEYKKAYLQQASSNLIKWQMDNQSTIELTRQRFLGVAFDKITRKYLPYGERMMNEKGASYFTSKLILEFDKSRQMMNMPEEMILMISEEFGHSIIGDILERQEEFEIPNNPSVWETVVNVLTNSVLTNYMRSKDGLTVDFLKNTEKIIQSTQDRMPTRDSGIFGFLRRKDGR